MHAKKSVKNKSLAGTRPKNLSNNTFKKNEI